MNTLRLTFALAVMLAINALLSAGEGFFDDFADGNATDGSPVSWELVQGFENGSYEASSGDFVLISNNGDDALVPYVPDYEFEDVSVRTRVHMEGSGCIAVGTRADAIQRNAYQGGICAGRNVIYFGRNSAPGGSYSRFTIDSTDLDVNSVDVNLQMDVIGDTISLFAWEANTPMPSEPQLTYDVTENQLTSGVVALIYAPEENFEEPGAGIYRFVQASPTPILDAVRGDFNGDGVLDASDIDALSADALAGLNTPRFDLNGDSLVNSADRQIWVEDLRKTWFGDSNLDGQFNSQDFVVVFQAGQYEDNISRNSTWATGDWKGDAEFDSGDFVTAFQAGGYEKRPGPNIAAVPEPASIALAVAALPLAFLVRKRPRLR